MAPLIGAKSLRHWNVNSGSDSTLTDNVTVLPGTTDNAPAGLNAPTTGNCLAESVIASDTTVDVAATPSPGYCDTLLTRTE